MTARNGPAVIGCTSFIVPPPSSPKRVAETGIAGPDGEPAELTRVDASSGEPGFDRLEIGENP
jgi:hypothetical protein